MNLDNTDKGRNVHRKAHRKSRLGCTFCKKRRIKCDEQTPTCTNCARRSLACSLDTSRSSAASSPSSTASLAASIQSGAATLDVRDFELFHHFCHVTSASFSTVKAAQHFWAVTVPRLSFEHPFLLHAILALGALHMGHMRFRLATAMPADLLHKANAHWTEALRLASPLLSQVSDSNCAALYLFATLTCLHTFALGPRPGELLLFNRNGPSGWLTFFHGLRSIEQACDLSSVQDEQLRPIFSLAGIDLSSVAFEELDPFTQDAFETLSLTIDADAVGDGERRETLLGSLMLLRACYTAVHVQPAGTSAHVVFSWLHRVSDHYLKLVQATDPVALLLFSYFVVLIKRMESAWMIRDWPIHLISEIHASMPPGKRSWLRWPMERIGWLPAG